MGVLRGSVNATWWFNMQRVFGDRRGCAFPTAYPLRNYEWPSVLGIPAGSNGCQPSRTPDLRRALRDEATLQAIRLLREHAIQVGVADLNRRPLNPVPLQSRSNP